MRGVILAVLLVGCLQSAPTPAEQPEPEDPRDLLILPDGAPRVEIVIHAAPGYEPHDASLAALRQEYGQLLNKPVDVKIVPYDTTADSQKRWTVAELRAIADALHALPVQPGAARLIAAILPGCADYDAGDSRDCIEGGAIGSVGFVMPDRRKDGLLDEERYGTPTGYHEAERYLLVHELAHVVGLVDRGVPPATDHVYADQCACHSTQEDSVMYGVQRGVVLDEPEGLLERVSEDNFYHYTFGEQDLADVRAYIASRA